MVLLPLLGLLAGAGIAAALLPGAGRDRAGAPAEAADRSEQTRHAIVLDAADYVGRPVDEVVAELTALGLDVERRQEPSTDVVPEHGDRRRARRRAARAPGDTVVVTYAGRPAPRGRRRRRRRAA